MPDAIPGGQWFENGFEEPRRFDSHSAHRQALAAEGCEIHATHVPGDQHLIDWGASPDAVTLANAAELVSRGVRAPEPEPERVPITKTDLTPVPPPLPERRALTLTSLQMATLRALERVLPPAGLTVVCARCVADYGLAGHMLFANAPEDAEWKADCFCTTRRCPRAALTHTLTPTSDLIVDFDALFRGTDLVIRCPKRASGCLWAPLRITSTATLNEIRCQCWLYTGVLTDGVHQYRKRARVAVAS